MFRELKELGALSEEVLQIILQPQLCPYELHTSFFLFTSWMWSQNGE